MLDFLRGAVRPIVTILGFSALTLTAMLIVLRDNLPEAVLVSVVSAFVQTTGMAVAFWFGTRKPGT